MSDWDFIAAPTDITVEIQVNQVAVAAHSLLLMMSVESISGLDDWIYRTFNALSPEDARHHRMALFALEQIEQPPREKTFRDWLAKVEEWDPLRLRDYPFNTWFSQKEGYPGQDALLADPETFVAFMTRIETEKEGHSANPDLWRWAYDYLIDPPRLKRAILDFLYRMWDDHLEPEWQRVEPMLQATAEAFNNLKFSRSSDVFDIIERVTGRDMRDKQKFAREMADARHLIFVPSPHVGPYIGWLPSSEHNKVILFGARSPQNIASSELGRSELLVRLNALADDTRLRILEMLTERDEMCAQDFINELSLSQSSASRHLRQLTASGYLSERRRDVAKCYSLNKERIQDTVTALKFFLKVEDC